MMFKNESEVVAKKAEKRYEALAKQKSPSSPTKKEPMTPDFNSLESWESTLECPQPNTNNAQVVPYTRYPTPESLTREIVPSIEDQALGFFIGNYVARPSLVPRGQFEWVTELLGQTAPEEILKFSVNAASLAGFANATKNPVIMQQAQAAYGSALRLTNNALRVKETAVKDSTLISVILLGLYENFLFRDRQSIQAWVKHVDGACALLNLRGEQQFESNLGRRLFHQFYGVILLVALETGKPVHPGMHDLYRAMTPSSDYSIHGRASARLVDVLHASIELNQDHDTEPITMVNTAMSLDRELHEIKEHMPSIWNYETVLLEEPSPQLYGTMYRIYLDPWIAQMWNNVSSCRICLFKIIRENLNKGRALYNPPLFSKEEYDSIKVAAENTSRATAASIVASVPQITGMIPFPDAESAKRRATDPRAAGPSPVHELCPPGTYIHTKSSTHMVHLIWPLYAAGGLDLMSSEMRQWTIDILHYIALRIGNRQAIVLADELKTIERTGVFTTPFADRTARFLP
jgi:hypothetical protein